MSSASALRPRSSPAEADQAEIADEAAVVAAQAAEEERSHRPGAELALAQQAVRRALRRGGHEALEVEQLRDPHEGGGPATPRGRWRDLGRGQTRDAGAVGRERQARVRDAGEPHDRALDAAGLRERHELARETGHQRVDAGALAGCP